MQDSDFNPVAIGPESNPEPQASAHQASGSQQLQSPDVVSREEILKQIFGDVGELIYDFSCAVESSVLLHGRMYITNRFICFYSNLFGLEKKIRIPYSHITVITKENTALIIPNAICITTHRKEYLFRSFWDRDECYKMLHDFIAKHKNHPAEHKSSRAPSGSLNSSSHGSATSSSSASSTTSAQSTFGAANNVIASNNGAAPSSATLPSSSVGNNHSAGSVIGTVSSTSSSSSTSSLSSNQAASASSSSSSTSAAVNGSTKRPSLTSSSSISAVQTERGGAGSVVLKSDSIGSSTIASSSSSSSTAAAATSSPGSTNAINNNINNANVNGTVSGSLATSSSTAAAPAASLGQEGGVTWRDASLTDDDAFETEMETTLSDPGQTQDHVLTFQEEVAKSKLKVAVISDQLNISLSDFVKLFIDDAAPHSWQAYHESVGDTGVISTNWSEATALLGSGREIKFVKSINMPGMRAATRGVKVQRYRRFGEAGLVLCCSTRLEDVPAADTFSVEDMIAVKSLGDNKVQVDISTEVKFIKSTMLRYMIEINTNAEMTKWLEAFYAKIKQVAAQHKLTESTRAKPKRKSITSDTLAAAAVPPTTTPAVIAPDVVPPKPQGIVEKSLDYCDKMIASWGLPGGRLFWVAWLLLLCSFLFFGWQCTAVTWQLNRVETKMATYDKQLDQLLITQRSLHHSIDLLIGQSSNSPPQVDGTTMQLSTIPFEISQQLQTLNQQMLLMSESLAKK